MKNSHSRGPANKAGQTRPPFYENIMRVTYACVNQNQILPIVWRFSSMSALRYATLTPAALMISSILADHIRYPSSLR